MTYFVYLNGPPGVGKDVIANLLADKYENVVHVKFAQMLRDAVTGIFGIDEEEYEAEKDNPLAIEAVAFSGELQGGVEAMSYREFVIRLSEKVLKPNFGKGYLGVALAERIKAFHFPVDVIYVVSDLGFNDELYELRDRVHCTDELLIHLYRKELNFDNDSRDYVTGVLRPVPVSTNCSIEDSVASVKSLINATLFQYADSLRESK